jgi:hypothetical protein
MKRLLEETKALAKDNHAMLRAIRRDQWLGFIGRIIIWLIVLAPSTLYLPAISPADCREVFDGNWGVCTIRALWVPDFR